VTAAVRVEREGDGESVNESGLGRVSQREFGEA
jgi:hypothetical protein